MKLLSFILLALFCGCSNSYATSKLYPADINYSGSFKPPSGERNGTDYGYANYASLGWDRSKGKLLAGGSTVDSPSKVEILTVPTLVTNHSFLAANLNAATVDTAFTDPTGGMQTPGVSGRVKSDIMFLEHQGNQTTDKYYWMTTFQYDVGNDTGGAFGWSETDFSSAAGKWRLDGVNTAMWSQYLFEINNTWADTHIDGKYIGMGRQRGNNSLGPSLYAVAPWEDNNGLAPADQAALAFESLINYPADHVMESYSYADNVTGQDAAWITVGSKQAFVVLVSKYFVGSDGATKFWESQVANGGVSYKYMCRNLEAEGRLTADISASSMSIPVTDASQYPRKGLLELYPEYILYDGVSGNNLLVTQRGARGTTPTAFTAAGNIGNPARPVSVDALDYGPVSGGPSSTIALPILMFYDVDQIAEIAAGTRASWDIQPYTYMLLDNLFFRSQSRFQSAIYYSDTGNVGLAYDSINNRLFVAEYGAFGAEPFPIYHVLNITDAGSEKDVTLPSPPTSVTISGSTVSWNAAADQNGGDVSYIIYKWYEEICGNGNNEFRPIIASLTTSWTDPHHVAGDTYAIQTVDRSMNLSALAIPSTVRPKLGGKLIFSVTTQGD